MDDTTSLTEFNSNAATLQRIDYWLRLAAQASYMGDEISYYYHLSNLRKEAIVKMKKKHSALREECEQKFKKITAIKAQYQKHRTSLEIKEILHQKLDEFEIFLRQFMDEKGMLLREQDNAKVALQQ